MKTYYGGQIKSECRGDLAVVVTARNHHYDTFMYPVGSEEFAHLTGVRSVRSPPERVYIGVSHNAGEAVTRATNDQKIDEINLESIDELVVFPYFLTTKDNK